MSKVYTHINVDLDAVASVWLWTRVINPNVEYELIFKPANWQPDGEIEKGDILLDMSAGIKGKNGGSCFQELALNHLSTQNCQALSELIQFVDALDRGNVIKNLIGANNKILACTCLSAVLRAFQAKYRRDPDKNRVVCEKMFDILDGMLLTGRARMEAKEEAKNAEWISKDVAITRDNERTGTHGVLFEDYGAKIIIYIDGCNLGMVKKDDVDVRLDNSIIKEIIGDEEGWYCDERGFLFARGTRKAPVDTPSKVNPHALAWAAVRLLETLKSFETYKSNICL